MDDSYRFQKEDDLLGDSPQDEGDQFVYGGEGEVESGYEDPDEEEDVPLPGVPKTDIMEALSQGFGKTVDGDEPRDELAEMLLRLRREQMEEPETDADPADMDADWGETVMEEEVQGDLEEEEEDHTIEDKNLRSALRQKGIDPDGFSLSEARRQIAESGDQIMNHRKEVMKLRWRQGLIAAATPVKYGEQTMQKLGDACGVHPQTLRQCKNMVEHFNYKESYFLEWLEDGPDEIKLWKDVLDEIQDKTKPTDTTTEGVEKFREKIIGKLEDMIEYMDQLNQMLEEVESEEVKREIEGPLRRAEEEIQRFVRTKFAKTGEFEDPEDPIPRSENYLEFIRGCPCAITGDEATVSRSDPHHDETGGTGTKGSDFSAIPLKRKIHEELHQKGEAFFEDKYGVTPSELRYAYVHKWTTGVWPEDYNLPEPTDW